MVSTLFLQVACEATVRPSNLCEIVRAMFKLLWLDAVVASSCQVPGPLPTDIDISVFKECPRKSCLFIIK